MTIKEKSEKLISSLKMEVKAYLGEIHLLQKLQTENEHDYVCGCWINEDSMCALSIRKRGEDYLAVLTDITKCYKVVRECFQLQSVKGKLIINQTDGTTTLEHVTHDPQQETIIFGSYGVFIPEDRSLLNELAESGDGLYPQEPDL